LSIQSSNDEGSGEESDDRKFLFDTVTEGSEHSSKEITESKERSNVPGSIEIQVDTAPQEEEFAFFPKKKEKKSKLAKRGVLEGWS